MKLYTLFYNIRRNSRRSQRVKVSWWRQIVSSSISFAVDGCPLTMTRRERSLWQQRCRNHLMRRREKMSKSERFGIETALESGLTNEQTIIWKSIQGVWRRKRADWLVVGYISKKIVKDDERNTRRNTSTSSSSFPPHSSRPFWKVTDVWETSLLGTGLASSFSVSLFPFFSCTRRASRRLSHVGCHEIFVTSFFSNQPTLLWDRVVNNTSACWGLAQMVQHFSFFDSLLKHLLQEFQPWKRISEKKKPRAKLGN